MTTNRSPLPRTKQALVLRTDFSSDAAWNAVCAAISQPQGEEKFLAYVEFVSDKAFEAYTLNDILAGADAENDTFVVVADATTMTSKEWALLVIDLSNERGRTFRALPSTIQAIENNLSIGNMDFEEFADSVDEDGVFRGFG